MDLIFNRHITADSSQPNVLFTAEKEGDGIIMMLPDKWREIGMPGRLVVSTEPGSTEPATIKADLTALLNEVLASPDPDTDAGDLRLILQDDMPLVEAWQGPHYAYGKSLEDVLRALLDKRKEV